MGLLGPCIPTDHCDKQSRQHGIRKVFVDSSGVGLPRIPRTLSCDFWLVDLHFWFRMIRLWMSSDRSKVFVGLGRWHRHRPNGFGLACEAEHSPQVSCRTWLAPRLHGAFRCHSTSCSKRWRMERPVWEFRAFLPMLQHSCQCPRNISALQKLKFPVDWIIAVVQFYVSFVPAGFAYCDPRFTFHHFSLSLSLSPFGVQETGAQTAKDSACSLAAGMVTNMVAWHILERRFQIKGASGLGWYAPESQCKPLHLCRNKPNKRKWEVVTVVEDWCFSVGPWWSNVVNVALKAAGGTSDLLDQDTLLGSAADQSDTARHGPTGLLDAAHSAEVFNCNDKERSTRESSMLPQAQVMPAWHLGLCPLFCCRESCALWHCIARGYDHRIWRRPARCVGSVLSEFRAWIPGLPELFKPKVLDHRYQLHHIISHAYFAHKRPRRLATVGMAFKAWMQFQWKGYIHSPHWQINTFERTLIHKKLSSAENQVSFTEASHDSHVCRDDAIWWFSFICAVDFWSVLSRFLSGLHAIADALLTWGHPPGSLWALKSTDKKNWQWGMNGFQWACSIQHCTRIEYCHCTSLFHHEKSVVVYSQDRFKTRFDSVLAASCCAKIFASVDAWNHLEPIGTNQNQTAKSKKELHHYGLGCWKGSGFGLERCPFESRQIGTRQSMILSLQLSKLRAFCAYRGFHDVSCFLKHFLRNLWQISSVQLVWQMKYKGHVSSPSGAISDATTTNKWHVWATWFFKFFRILKLFKPATGCGSLGVSFPFEFHDEVYECSTHGSATVAAEWTASLLQRLQCSAYLCIYVLPQTFAAI